MRHYDSLLWASTNVSGVSIEAAGDVAFGRLFGYISGANAAGTAVDMTAPVLNRVVPGAGPNCNSTFTISFFTPYALQTDAGPPAPTADDVFVGTIGPLAVAVAEFPGFAHDDDIVAHAAALEEAVEAADGLAMDAAFGDSWWFAAYDSPYRLTNRHNEVWVPVVVA